MKTSISRFFSKLNYMERGHETPSPVASEAKKTWSVTVGTQSEVASFLIRLDECGATMLRIDPILGAKGDVRGFRIDYEHRSELPKAT